MIKIVIIEDEIPAREKLKRFINELKADTLIVAEIATISDAINFLKLESVDVIFSDIELLDGNAFEIYNTVPISCPIVFTTAYNQFWSNAFESNGIEYLLKPFTKERFQKAWDKFLLLRGIPINENGLLLSLTKLLEQNFNDKSYKKRFTISSARGIYFLETLLISFFEAKDGVVLAYDENGKKHLLTETTLKEIEQQLDPFLYFRINRGALVSKKHIELIERLSKNSLLVKMKGCIQHLKTSQGSTAAFRYWVEK